ncbi:unnamed protein product [Urochloa humidicola]
MRSTRAPRPPCPSGPRPAGASPPQRPAPGRSSTVAAPSWSSAAIASRRPTPGRSFAAGTISSSNALVEKPLPPLQKPSKVSPPPPKKKPSKLSPPPLPKPSKTSPPAMPKPSKLSPPAMQKPSKMSPPNPVRATKPSKLAAKPLKKVAPGADLEAKAKKRSQRVSFQMADVGVAAARSGEKVKAHADDTAGHTPMVAMRAAEKPSKVLSAETPFFSAQNCSSCTLDQLESAAYWLGQIRLAESVGKHWVAAAFFRLAFECQAQPIHRIQSELRSYTVRHESAGTLISLFDDLLTAHGMPVNQPKFDTDGCEKMDTPIANAADTATLKVDECLECDSGDDLIDVGAIIVDKHDEDVMDQPCFQRKLDESFEFDDSEAVIVDQLDETNFDLLKNIEIKVPFSTETIQSPCRSATEKLSPRGSIIEMDSSSGHLSSDIPSDKFSPGMGSLSSKRLSSGSTFDKNSSLSSKRLASSCPYKKSASIRDMSSKQMSSGGHSDARHNALGGAADHESKVTRDVASKCPALPDQLELEGPEHDAASNEMH